MKTLKKINLRGLSNILSEKELKNVVGGSGSCSHDGAGEYVFNVFYQGCYWTVWRCFLCGKNLRISGTEVCVATP